MKQLSASELNNLSKADLAAMVLQMQQLQQQLQQQINTLNEKIAIMNARHFGRSTEKLDTLPGQMSVFNEAEAAAAEAIAEPAIEQVVVRKKKQKGQRKEDLNRLPVRIENHELTKEQLNDIYGENGWKRLPDEVYSRVEYHPAVREVVEHHVAVYAAKKNDDRIVRADRPVDLLRGSIATPSLVAAIMNAKYTNAIPLYRIAQDFEQNDMILSRATMANWVIRCSERYLSLVYDRLQEHLCRHRVIQVDETTCQVTKDGRGEGVSKSYMFVYRTSELSQGKTVILYQYGKTRSKSNIQKFLEGFSGTLVSDAFSGYKSLDKNDENIRSAFCWAHARRDYTDALKALKGDAKELSGETIPHKALVQISAIYKAEEALKNVSAEERKTRRQREVAPLVEAYFAWVHAQDPATILSEKTKDGLKYSLNQEKYLKVFLEDGEVPIDNSATERAIRPFTIGRSNWHIIDTIHGAQASAVIYSLVETAKANKLKIYEYLKHLLTEIPKHMDDSSLDFLEDLLPWSENLPEECRKKSEYSSRGSIRSPVIFSVKVRVIERLRAYHGLPGCTL